MALIRFIISAILDIVRETQRAAAVASGAMLITLTLMIAATSYPGLEPVLVGAFVGTLHIADTLPFIDLEPYFSADADGGARLSFSGVEEADGFLQNALLPFYAWLTAFLVVLRWLFRVTADEAGFWPRYRPVLVLSVACLAVYITAALTRDDVTGLAFLVLLLVVLTLVTGAWSALVSATLDGWVRKLAPESANEERLDV
ncbi:MAG: hypothetical protein GYB36_01695 [Alphaproteobacteria bacterium]|nr:hypothetical protein [Alphaproteobacteria bacterium]